MHALGHGGSTTLAQALAGLAQAVARMRFLDAIALAAGQDGEILRVAVDQVLRDGADVGDEAVEKVEGHALADNDTEDLCLLLVGRERVVGDDVLFGSEQVGDGLLLDVWEFLLEFIREAECDHG